jgi:DHA1 family multidrug resistance protein-like MFS transporter
MMITAPFWGALADRYGRKIMVERAMFGGAVIILCMAFIQTAEQLVLLRAIQGLITGTVAAANALVASVVPRPRSGYAMGLLQVGTGSGVALGPMIGGFIADAFGYAPTFYVTSFLLLVGGLLVMLGVKEHFVPIEDLKRNRISLLDKWQQVLKSTGVLVTFGMRFLTQMGRMMIVPVIPLFVLELMPGSAHVNTFTGLTVGVASVTTTLSAIFLGRLGDRRGHRRVVIFSAMVASGLYWVQGQVSSEWGLLVLQALVGVAAGGLIPGISALLAQYTAAGMEGAVYGLDNSIDAAGRAVAPLIGSGVAAAFSLSATFTATGLVLAAAGLLALWRLPEILRGTDRASLGIAQEAGTNVREQRVN